MVEQTRPEKSTPRDSSIGLDVEFPLRVADALDREHVQRVTDLTAKLGDNELTLRLDGTSGLLLEGCSLKKNANLFQKIFGRKVKLRFLGEEQVVEA